MQTYALVRFVALYALMYGAFGVASPFMPAFFERRAASDAVRQGRRQLL